MLGSKSSRWAASAGSASPERGFESGESGPSSAVLDAVHVGALERKGDGVRKRSRRRPNSDKFAVRSQFLLQGCSIHHRTCEHSNLQRFNSDTVTFTVTT